MELLQLKCSLWKSISIQETMWHVKTCSEVLLICFVDKSTERSGVNGARAGPGTPTLLSPTGRRALSRLPTKDPGRLALGRARGLERMHHVSVRSPILLQIWQPTKTQAVFGTKIKNNRTFYALPTFTHWWKKITLQKRRRSKQKLKEKQKRVSCKNQSLI